MAVCSPGSEPSGFTGKAWIVHSLLIGAAVAAAAVAAHGGFFRWLLRRGCYRSRVVGIIPARFASSRFQGKPLVPILGKPMIQRTWERATMASTLDHVVVATDDETIAKCCRGFGAHVVMTSEACKNGTERCYEALEKLGKDYDVVVNIQGDEPLIEPEIIDGIVKALQASPDAVFSTAVTSLCRTNPVPKILLADPQDRRDRGFKKVSNVPTPRRFHPSASPGATTDHLTLAIRPLGNGFPRPFPNGLSTAEVRVGSGKLLH